MEVELDREAPAENWRAIAADWAACCRETWLCEELALFRVREVKSDASPPFGDSRCMLADSSAAAGGMPARRGSSTRANHMHPRVRPAPSASKDSWPTLSAECPPETRPSLRPLSFLPGPAG